MKTKILILAFLLTFDVILGVCPTKQPILAPAQKTATQPIDIRDAVKRLDTLAKQIERNIKYVAPCTD